MDKTTTTYTNHLTEQVRIDLGKMLISHEMTKLFPSLDYEEVKRLVDGKWSNLSEVVSIRDFWNLVDSLMAGYKLKDLVKDITSQQYSWSLIENQEVTEVKFSTDINNLKSNGKTAADIKTFFDNNPEELGRIKQGTQCSQTHVNYTRSSPKL